MKTIFENSMPTSDKFLGDFKGILIELEKSGRNFGQYCEKTGKIYVILVVSLKKS